MKVSALPGNEAKPPGQHLPVPFARQTIDFNRRAGDELALLLLLGIVH